jgi:dipeptidyl-peptidase-4
VYRVRLDGSGFERLSIAEGTHTALFNPTFSHYVDTWSNATTPPQVRLHKSGVGEVRVLDSNTASALGEFKLSKPEFLTVSTRDGFAMEAMMIKPPDFDPSHRYPVYQFTYGGPASPQVRNAWGGSTYLYHQFLAQQGIIVWICDNRTASGKGAESAWPVYRRFGELELQDIEDGVAWLKRQPYVDPTRIGLHGWSYGGYMTLFALTHSRSFAMGIAGGPVTDWRDYDTVYTERFMGLPEENADAYRRSSPRWFAKELSAPLLLIHGTMDDNVHVANTLQFAYELQQAQRPFRMMLYAKSRHGITDPSLAKHLRAMMVDFIVEHLKKPLPGGTDGAR